MATASPSKSRRPQPAKAPSPTALQESTLLEGGTVDADAGVIRGVKILGRESKNGRSYSDQAMREAAGFYEGIEVNIDHPDKSKPGADRKLSEAFGFLEHVAVKADGVYGDLQFLKAHPQAASFVEAAERMPGKLGLSHNAEGHTTTKGGKTVVESIVGVRSVDLVRNPASSRGLFESGGSAVTTTIREVFEALPASCKAKAGLLQLLEDDPTMGAAPMDMPAADADSDGQIDAAFKSAIVAVLDDGGLDVKAKLKRIGEILKAQEKAMAAISGPAEEPAAEEPATVESLQAEVQALRVRDEVRGLIESANVTATAVQLEAAASLPTADKRKAFVESLPKRSQAAARPAFSRPLYESTGGTTTKVPEPKDFAKAIR